MEWLVQFFQIDDCSPEAITAVATCILAILAIATLLVILLVGWRQLRQLRKDSHKQLISGILDGWGSQSMIKARGMLMKVIRGEGSPSTSTTKAEQILKEASKLKEELYELERNGDEKYYEIVQISDYMERLGYMMESKQDRQTVKDLLGDAVVNYYLHFQLWIEEERKKYPRIYEYFTEIYEYCKK